MTLTLQILEDPAQLNRIETMLIQLLKGQNTVVQDLTALQAAVANEKTVEDSAVKLITGLSAQIQTLINQSANTVDPAALQEIINAANANATALAAAVAANTPASAPPPPPPPPPPPVA